MEIRSNINEMTKKADNYGKLKGRMRSIREDLVNIITGCGRLLDRKKWRQL